MRLTASIIFLVLLLSATLVSAALFSVIIFQASAQCPQNAKYCKLEIYKNGKYFGSRTITRGANIELILKAFYTSTTTTTTPNCDLHCFDINGNPVVIPRSCATTTTSTTICEGSCFGGCTRILCYDYDGTPIGEEVPCS